MLGWRQFDMSASWHYLHVVFNEFFKTALHIPNLISFYSSQFQIPDNAFLGHVLTIIGTVIKLTRNPMQFLTYPVIGFLILKNDFQCSIKQFLLNPLVHTAPCFMTRMGL